ncbi:hypothetical protein MTO96_013603 [Rhipicephalus appendiculatus]
MDSCFGARSLFGGHSSADTLFSSTQLEVIQDLDLYFIRQIAHSLGPHALEHSVAQVANAPDMLLRPGNWCAAEVICESRYRAR